MIDAEDTKGIADLMDGGFSFQEAMDLLENRSNHTVFERIRKRLAEGEVLSSFLQNYLPASYRPYLNGFLQYLPLDTSLLLAIAVTESEEKQKKQIMQSLFYPCMLFLASLIGVIAFNELCFPPLLSMMESFSIEISSFQHLHRLLRAGCLLLLILLGMLLVAAGWFLQKRHVVKGYQWISRHLPHSFLKELASMDFVRFFLEMILRSIPTRKSLFLLMQIKEKPLTAWIAKELDASLQNGISWSNALESPCLDPALTRFMKIAIFSSSMESMLKSYLAMAEKRLQRQCRIFTRIIQLLSYSSIGLILVLVYQVLMVPLQILMQI